MVGFSIAQLLLAPYVMRIQGNTSSLTLDANMLTFEIIEKKKILPSSSVINCLREQETRSIDKAGVLYYLACYMPEYSRVAEIRAVT